MTFKLNHNGFRFGGGMKGNKKITARQKEIVFGFFQFSSKTFTASTPEERVPFS